MCRVGIDDYEIPLTELGGGGNGILFSLVIASSSYFNYQPVLKCLQSMSTIPLAEEIVHGRTSVDGPEYLPRVVRLPMDFGSVRLDLQDWSSEELLSKTSLNESQCESLRVALTRKVPLIRGPPGTGKTFMGGLIVRIILRFGGKVLVMCQTNHALDQFLEYLLDNHVNDIVRVGGCTKSSRLEPYTLQNLARSKVDAPRDVRRAIWNLRESLELYKRQINELQSRIRQPIDWEEMSQFLLNENEHIYDQLFFNEVDRSGFRAVGRKGKARQADYLWKSWCNGDRLPSVFNLSLLSSHGSSEDIWLYTKDERLALKATWESGIRSPATERLQRLFLSYLDVMSELNNVRRDGHRAILSQARVIGVTTNGASKYKDLLANSSVNVLVVEEVGEVLEAHILASLTGSIEHLILIGDEKQLRPKIECHNLRAVANRGYNLDCSLFERLVLCSNLKCITLNVQHRMRPSISQLIRMSTYPQLVDAESVTAYPHVQGLTQDLVFIDHREPEGSNNSGVSNRTEKSKVNLHESLLQGYKPAQLVVLTPYLGQLRAIQKQMLTDLKDVSVLIAELDKAELLKLGIDSDDDDEIPAKPVGDAKTGVRVSTVDNYQGEESDLVIASLVRSNPRGDIGFLKEPQRVNVLLSRAKLGMILIGNSETLVVSEAGLLTWGHLLQHFKDTDVLTTGLPTYCQLHPDNVVQLIRPADFRAFCPNGGCTEKCSS